MPSSGFFGPATGWVSANPGVSLLIALALVLIIIYLAAVQLGWVDSLWKETAKMRPPPAGKAPKRPRKPPPPPDDDDDEDDEVDELIDALNA